MVRSTVIFLLTLSPFSRAEVYSIGEPTNDEQYYVELINRARANPTAEGIRIAATTDPSILFGISFFGVSLDSFKAEMAVIPAKPPLAINPILTTAARGHSEYMFNIGQQTHFDADGLSWNARGTAAGYTNNLAVENITDSSWFNDFGHAAFELDWGAGSGGMQSGRPHRLAIHYDNIKEVGVGVSYGEKVFNGRTIGPQQMTQDFGVGPVDRAFITGVVYHDINENDFYDPGEGIGGVQVNVEGGSDSGITAGSGGYAVPVPTANATHDLTFVGPGILSQASAIVSGGNNVKVDLVLDYAAPVVIGTTAPAVGIPAIYQVSPVTGATSYDWRKNVEIPAVNDEAEDLSRVTVTGSDEYSMLASDVKYAGDHCYHLFHEAFSDRALTYDSDFNVSSEGAVSFRSRLILALPDEAARVQVSEDEGSSWTTVWSQAGAQGAGESDFEFRNVSLAAYSGKSIRLRFLYDYISGNIYGYPIGQPIGWYVDQIAFTGISTISGEVTSSTEADRSFEFGSDSSGEFFLSARPVFPGRIGSFGPSIAVEASAQNSYADYASAQESAFGLPASSILSNPEGDANDDGIANVMAYALGLSPMASAYHRLPQVQQAGDQIVVDYTTYGSRSDVNFGSEASTGLGAWASSGEQDAPDGFTDEVMSTDGEVVNRRAALPAGGSAAAYMRLRANLK